MPAHLLSQGQCQDSSSTGMGPAVLAKPLLPDTPGGARKCRPQPPRHPRLETYPEPLLKELSTYCYTCESRAVGAEALLHLYFGELGCNHCFHNIKSCLAFRTRYPMLGLCKGSGEEHNACRWVAPTCKYVMYNTRKTLSMARCINNKFEKQEVFREATAYLRALLPLRGMYPWRSALKTIAKAGIAVDLSKCPPRLEPLHPSEAGRAVGKGMLGVTGLLNLEKSITRLEKRDKLRDGPARMQNTPGSTQNNSDDTHTTHANTDNTHGSTDHPSSVNSTPAGTESFPVPVESLQKSLNKTKLKSRTSTECNILACTENYSNIQTQHKLHKKGKSRNTDTNTENASPSTRTAPTRTENSPVSTETPHECHKKEVVKKNSVCVQPQNYFSETPKPSAKTSVTSQCVRPDLERRKRKKMRVEDASAEKHHEEREEAALKDMFTSVANTAVTSQGTLPPRAKKKKKKLQVPSTTTGNTALTHQDILPSSREERQKAQLKHAVADVEITPLTTQDLLPVTAENPIIKKHKKKIKNSLTIGNKPASAAGVLPDDAFLCVENTASRKQRKAEYDGGSEPPSASALPLGDTLPPSANISPKTHRKRKQKNAPEAELEATSVQDVSPGNAQLGSEESSTSKKHKRRKLKRCDNVKFEVVGAQDPFPVTSLPSSAENTTTSKKHKRKELKSHDETESEAAPKQRKRKLKNSGDVEREPLGKCSAFRDTLHSSGCVEDSPSRGAEAENSPRKCQSTPPSTPAATEDVRASTQDSPSDKSTLRKTKRKKKLSSAASQGNSYEARQPSLDVQHIYNILPELLKIVATKNNTEKDREQKVKSSSATARDISL